MDWQFNVASATSYYPDLSLDYKMLVREECARAVGGVGTEWTV